MAPPRSVTSRCRVLERAAVGEIQRARSIVEILAYTYAAPGAAGGTVRLEPVIAGGRIDEPGIRIAIVVTALHVVQIGRLGVPIQVVVPAHVPRCRVSAAPEQRPARLLAGIDAHPVAHDGRDDGGLFEGVG